LTFDGLYRYTHDVLNRLVKVTYRTGSGSVAYAEYEYEGMKRRLSKAAVNFGVGVVTGSDEGGTIAGIQNDGRREIRREIAYAKTLVAGAGGIKAKHCSRAVKL
jgi:hypothetical protein